MADTALVTGASAGLGVGFARALAARGDDVILVARRTERLETLAAELRAAHSIRAEVIASDLAAPGAVAALMREVSARGLAVNILVNNAGFGLRGDFAALDGAGQARMVDLNCRALMELAHAVLPGMLQMRRGGILNVASTAAFQPGPWMSVYYASKAFVLSFSEALHHEVKSRGVRVACLCPGATRTEFASEAKMEDTPLFKGVVADPDHVVRVGLRALDRNQAVVIPGLLGNLMATGVRFAPRAVARAIAASLQKPD